jgi:hypothetical protein
MSAKVLEFPSLGSDDDYSSLQSKLMIYQKLNREWAEHLDPYEFRVLSAIVDRTVGWGRTEAQFSAGRLLRGDKVNGPLNLSRPKLYRVLSSLEGRGMIRRRADAFNPDKTHYSVRLDWSPKMALNLPKRLKKDATGCKSERVSLTETRVSLTETRVSLTETQYTGNPYTGNQRTGNAASSDREPPNPVSTIRATIERTVASHAEAKATRLKVRSQRATSGGVEAAWRDALRETFPDVVEPVWTGREKGQAKRLASGWANFRQISFIDFTDWAVRNWTQIMRKQFKWMTKNPPPAVPAFNFYVAMIDQFAECWGEGKLEEWASAEERTEIERMMARGMTFEQATAEFAKRHAIAELRDEMRVREIKVRARSRAADIKLKQAERLAEFGGKAPVHPRSIAAQEIRARNRVKLQPVANDPEFVPLSAPMVSTKNPFDE